MEAELEIKLGYKPYFIWVKNYWTARGEPLDFEEHKYLKQIYQDQHPNIVFKKSAQTGFTERMITEAIWLADQFKENSLYFFPTSGTIGDMVQERVDEPINNSEYLTAVSGRAKKLLGKQADKVGLKRFSKGFTYFRGANKPTQITSSSGDAVFIDEIDRMPVENIPYLDKRTEHSKRKWMRCASTPTIPNFGIDRKYTESDQHECWITCTKCNEKQTLTFWDNVDIEKEQLVCKKCNEEIVPWKCEMEWIAKNPDSDVRGYYINQLYSPRLNIKNVIKESKKTAEWEIMQFYNQILGLAYEPKGSKVGEEDIDACIRDYTSPMKEDNTFMGVDVGKALHIIIRGKKKILYIGDVKDFEDVDKLMDSYNVKKCVVDALPETREVQKFIDRFPGRAFFCYYSGLKEVKKGEWFKREKDSPKINTDRTLALDMVTDEIKTQEIEMPKNIRDYIEFIQHLKSLTRVVQKDSKGNVKASYVETGPDHLFHAVVYATIAKYIFYSTTDPEIFIL